MGPSGCGKSTLLNILGLIDSPSEGDIFYNDRQISALSENDQADFRRDHIGYVFQNFNLIDELTVFENVELPLIYARVARSKRRDMVEKNLRSIAFNASKKSFSTAALWWAATACGTG